MTSVPAQPVRWEPLDEPGVGGRLTALAVDPDKPDRVLVGGDLLGIGYSDDGGASWERVDGLLSHEISSFTFHPERPNQVWVGTMSGPHVSNDGGRTWEPRRVGLPEIEEYFYSAPIEAVLVDPRVPGRLLAFGGSRREWTSLGDPAWGAVWESVDAGSTWTRLATIADGTNVVAVVQVDGRTLLAAAEDRGIHRSTDGGRTWEASSVGLPHGNVRGLAAVPGGDTVYAALGEGPLDGAEHVAGGVYRSDDGGLTWQFRSDGLPLREAPTPELTSRFDAVAVSNVDPETIWTADLAFGLEAVYRSDDGGASWQLELEGDGVDDIDTAYSSPVTAEVLVPDQRSNQLRFVAQGEYVLRRQPDGEWVDATSIDGGSGRAGTGYSGLVATDIAFDPGDPDQLVVTALDGGQYLRSDDGGETWNRPLTTWDQWGGSQALTIAGPDGSHEYVLLGQFGRFNGIAASTDGGTSWTFAAGAEAGLPERSSEVSSLDDIVALDGEPERVVATIDGGIFVSDDAGASWERLHDGSYSALATGPDDEIYVADEAAVHRFDPVGGTVEALSSSPADIDTLTVDPTEGTLYAVRWGLDDDTDGGISRWDGTSWRELCLDPNCSPTLERYATDLAVDPTDPDHLVVATGDLPFHDVVGSPGVFESFDGGESWSLLGEGLTLRRVIVVEFDPHQPRHLVIGTMGGGFFEAMLPE